MPPDARSVVARFNAFARRHSAFELIVIAEIWGRLALVDMRLKVSPPHLKRRWLFDHSFVGHASLAPALRTEALRLERLVAEASSHPIFFNMSCLRRALVLRSLLAARKIPSRLIFGIRGSADESVPEAHAWLELDGLTLGLGSDSKSSDFIAFHRGMGSNQK